MRGWPRLHSLPHHSTRTCAVSAPTFRSDAAADAVLEDIAIEEEEEAPVESLLAMLPTAQGEEGQDGGQGDGALSAEVAQLAALAGDDSDSEDEPLASRASRSASPGTEPEPKAKDPKRAKKAPSGKAFIMARAKKQRLKTPVDAEVDLSTLTIDVKEGA